MSMLLTSEEFRQYFESMTNVTITDHNRLIAYMNNAIKGISGVIHIGKVDVKRTSPSNPFERVTKMKKETLFQDDRNYDDRPIEKRYEAGDRGKVIVTIYPTKGHVWTEEELKELDTFSRSTHLFMAYSRLLILINKLAGTDVQTNMPNYAAVAQFAGKCASLKELKNYTGIFINIKNFKYVNKSASSKCGDLCLTNYGHILMDYVGQNGIVGRLGGDNFVAIVHDSIAEDFIKFASCVSITCEMPERNYRFKLISRMGVYNIREKDTLSEVMNCSSIAYNFSKKRQISDIEYFEDWMLKEMLHLKEVSASFPQALADNEFMVYYQPIVDVATNTICAGEALSRWIKNGKMVSPAEFIQILEDEGSICKLDFYVFDSVCKSIREWIDKGIEPVRISVNFSRLHLYNDEFVENILEVINKYDVDPEYIEVEITETSGYEDYEILQNFVNEMNKNGISTAIDDFGTGYSSMSLLTSLNTDVIKIDKSFFDYEDDNSKSRIMTKSVIGMIKELGMQTIAEGVETAELRDYLKEIGCDMIQGYFYDKPLSVDVFEEKIKNKNCYQE